MKTVKEGNPWWVGKSVTCKACGCEFVLELRDKPRCAPHLNYLDSVMCPTCEDCVQVHGNPEIETKLNKQWTNIANQIAEDREMDKIRSERIKSELPI